MAGGSASETFDGRAGVGHDGGAVAELGEGVGQGGCFGRVGGDQRQGVWHAGCFAVRQARARRARGQQFGEGRHVPRAHLEHGAPVAPAGDDAIHQAAQGFGVDTQAGRAVHQGGQQAPAGFVLGDADLGQGPREMQGEGDGLEPRTVGQARLVRKLVVEGGADQDVRQPPLGQHAAAQDAVVETELFLLQRQEGKGVVGGVEDGRIFLRVERGEAEFADAGKQADGEVFLAGDLGMAGQVLAGDGGGQRAAPEAVVIERRAFPGTIRLQHREADDQVAHAEGTQRDDGPMQRHHRPRATEGGGVGVLEQAAGNGRVGLHQPYQVVYRKLVPLHQPDDGDRDATRRGQPPRGLEFRIAFEREQPHR